MAAHRCTTETDIGASISEYGTNAQTNLHEADGHRATAAHVWQFVGLGLEHETSSLVEGAPHEQTESRERHGS